jgi:Domain of unknown function (DUF4386)
VGDSESTHRGVAVRKVHLARSSQQRHDRDGQVAFANARVALGSFAVCCGWVIASTGFLPRWLGWLAIASGVGLALSRISWTSYIWLLPYGMFWLWVIIVALLLLRRNFRGVAKSG